MSLAAASNASKSHPNAFLFIPVTASSSASACSASSLQQCHYRLKDGSKNRHTSPHFEPKRKNLPPKSSHRHNKRRAFPKCLYTPLTLSTCLSCPPSVSPRHPSYIVHIIRNAYTKEKTERVGTTAPVQPREKACRTVEERARRKRVSGYKWTMLIREWGRPTWYGCRRRLRRGW